MKAIIISIILIQFSFIGKCQEQESAPQRPRDLLSLSFLGDVSILSANYEGILTQSRVFFLSGKLGLGYNKQEDACWMGGCPELPKSYYLTIPHHITGNLGKGKSYFEFGFVGTAFIGDSPDAYSEKQNYVLSTLIGYRLYPTSSQKIGFRFFVYFPITNPDELEVLFIPLGINIGYAF